MKKFRVVIHHTEPGATLELPAKIIEANDKTEALWKYCEHYNVTAHSGKTLQAFRDSYSRSSFYYCHDVYEYLSLSEDQGDKSIWTAKRNPIDVSTLKTDQAKGFLFFYKGNYTRDTTPPFEFDKDGILEPKLFRIESIEKLLKQSAQLT